MPIDPISEYSVYVLRNPSGRTYIGLSTDVLNRLTQHNAGLSQWTRGRGPWRLEWTSAPMSLREAHSLERLLKRQKGGDGLRRILEAYRRKDDITDRSQPSARTPPLHHGKKTPKGSE